MAKIVQDIQFLRKKSTDVKTVDEARKLIDELESTLSKIDNGVGLAAVQIGKPKKVGVIKGRNGYVHLINPVVVSKENEFIYSGEGCLSFPGTFKNTKRYKDFTIKHIKIEGDRFKEETLSFYFSADPYESNSDGRIAIAVQHEMEHFDGGLILDHDYEVKPIQRTSEKIGRNDPCSCGSGKKYKKCCGNNQSN